ncbi:hypothetical protein HMPREF2805_01280 [Streptococcus sp. HMSC034E03]|uniref:hypothetical protein n=1 Tax=Streptococcus sp. HMSC034E03 TaxID=1739309 RepID=UPI0008D50C48|nr:hypothetical protein [Streptococcus sp. HMSC034E03]OFK77418.1 hypothetical protein HMPREF2805_01280 [Streptococcus sp. HMSC034E03]
MVKKFNIKNGWAEVNELTHDFLVPVPDVSTIRCLFVEFVKKNDVFFTSALGRLKNAPSPISCRIKILLQKNRGGIFDPFLDFVLNFYLSV